MGCQSCGNKDKTAVAYPREIVLSDGSRVTVTSAADERVARERFRQAEREKARTTGYTVRR